MELVIDPDPRWYTSSQRHTDGAETGIQRIKFCVQYCHVRYYSFPEFSICYHCYHAQSICRYHPSVLLLYAWDHYSEMYKLSSTPDVQWQYTHCYVEVKGQ